MEEGGLDTPRQRTSSTSSQAQDCDQMLERGKQLPNKKVIPEAMVDDDGGLIPKGSIKEKVVWSKEDEITILKGLMKLKMEIGDKSKKIDYIALYDSIKHSLHRESVTINHLKKKLKCLREKYMNKLKKAMTPSIPQEDELFYLSAKIWGDSSNKDHEIDKQFSSIMPYDSLDVEASDKVFVEDLGLALATTKRNQCNPEQVALEQYKLVSQSLSTRKHYANQILEARMTPKKEELSELVEQKLTRSYFDAKIQHARLVSDAYNASHGFENSLINITADCGLKKNTPKAMNESNCPLAIVGCQKPITGKPSNTSPKSVSEMYHSEEREKKKKRKIKKQENRRDSSTPSYTDASLITERATSSQIRTLVDGMTVEVLVKGNPDGKVASPGNQEELSELEEQKITRSYFDAKIQHAQLVSDSYNANHGFENSLINIAADCGLKKNTPKAMNEGNCQLTTVGCQKPITVKPSNTSPKSASEMYHSQEREKKKKRKIKKQEIHRDSSTPSYTAASFKEITESATSSQIRTLVDGMTVEVLVKGNPNGKVASPGNQVKIYFIAKLRDTECSVGSNSTDGTPHKIRLGDKKVLKGLNIGIEGMRVGEKRRLTIPPSLGYGCKAKPPILPDSWLQYDVELVDICE